VQLQRSAKEEEWGKLLLLCVASLLLLVGVGCGSESAAEAAGLSALPLGSTVLKPSQMERFCKITRALLQASWLQHLSTRAFDVKRCCPELMKLWAERCSAELV
jgi:hypothetical protein